ncbi:uncharacterized protein LOC130736207 [Lotus japonicus]|uniref:uncharacterized protein LOC130736207 n=1 Tax=Lotus japonicus TaxID=34305 RepID=UPI00258A20EE|nr:uncharacterized protein LOC130736207 [Lotus japonicus]
MHIDIHNHFIRELVEEKIIMLEHVDTEAQLADIFTKVLDAVKFEKIRSELGVCLSTHLTYICDQEDADKHVGTKKKIPIVSPNQENSENFIHNPEVVVDPDIEHAVDLLYLSGVRVFEQDVEPNVEKSKSSSESSDETQSDEVPVVKDSVVKDVSTKSTKTVPEPYSRKANRLKKKMTKELVKSSHRTPKTYKSSPVQVPEKKKKEKKKGKGKDSVSKSKKRKHVSESDSEPDVELGVLDISTTARKRVKGKRVPLNVAEVPMDNVSFHSAENAQRWKFVYHRKLSRARELGEEALGSQKIMDLLSEGLMKTVKDLGRCYEKLVRKFIVNIPSDCDDESSVEYNKVFVRGKCVNFSPTVINEYLGRSSEAVIEVESDLHEVACVITCKLVKKWPKKGLLPSRKSTIKYSVLNKIGAANWVATNHTYGVTPQLARLIFFVGTRAKFDFGNHVFEQTIKHAGSFVVKLPITFPCLLTKLVRQQHPDIVRADEPQAPVEDEAEVDEEDVAINEEEEDTTEGNEDEEEEDADNEESDSESSYV